MGLRLDPGGGGQFKGAIQQIMEAESQPLKAMSARKAKEESRLKLLQEFKGKVDGLQKSLLDVSRFRKFRELKVDMGDGENYASVTLDQETAEPGQYTLEIDTLAARSSFITNRFESPTEPVFGMGFVTFSLENGENFEVYVDEQRSSLRGIASAINQNPNSPLRASVVADQAESDAPWRLILTAKEDGLQNQISSPEFYFDGEDIYVDEDKEAENALIYMNGFELETASNDIAEFLPGVGLHLKQANPDHPFTITISEDTQKTAGKVKALVETLNQVLQFINKQNAIDDKTDTSSTFAGDSSLASMEYQLRNLVHRRYLGGTNKDGDPVFYNLSSVGIEFDKSGQVQFKEDRFVKALEKDFEQVANVFVGAGGIAEELGTLANNYGRPSDGMLKIKERSLQNRISEIDRRIEDKNRSLDRKRQSLVDRFSRLESSLGNLQRQQQYLSAVLPSGGGILSQLVGG